MDALEGADVLLDLVGELAEEALVPRARVLLVQAPSKRAAVLRSRAVVLQVGLKVVDRHRHRYVSSVG